MAELRRADDVDPAVELLIDRKQQETRHWARDELASIGVRLELLSVTSSKEHAEVAGKLDLVIAATTDLPARVTALETAAAVDRAEEVTRAELRRQSRGQFRWLVALIVAAVPSVAAIVSLLH